MTKLKKRNNKRRKLSQYQKEEKDVGMGGLFE